MHNRNESSSAPTSAGGGAMPLPVRDSTIAPTNLCCSPGVVFLCATEVIKSPCQLPGVLLCHGREGLPSSHTCSQHTLSHRGAPGEHRLACPSLHLGLGPEKAGPPSWSPLLQALGAVPNQAPVLILVRKAW